MSVLQETILGLKEAASHFPGAGLGKRLSFSTMWRWVVKGIKISGAITPVKLEAIRLGGRWITSQEAIARFAEALTKRQMTPPISSPSHRQRQANAAKKKLGADWT